MYGKQLKKLVFGRYNIWSVIWLEKARWQVLNLYLGEEKNGKTKKIRNNC